MPDYREKEPLNALLKWCFGRTVLGEARGMRHQGSALLSPNASTFAGTPRGGGGGAAGGGAAAAAPTPRGGKAGDAAPPPGPSPRAAAAAGGPGPAPRRAG
eukprot:tig00021013_g17065.t1